VSDPATQPTASETGRAGAPSPVVPPLRSDIEVASRHVAGRAEYVLKDPLSNRYFRLGETEWFVAALFDGQRTLDDVHARAAQQFPDLDLPAHEIRRFVARLALAGMLRLTGRQDLDRLLAHAKPGWLNRLLAVAGQVFYFRIPVVNPDRFIGRLTPHLAALFTPQTLVLVGLIAMAAAGMILWQGHRLAEPQAEFLSPAGLLCLLAALIVIKILHELGHAVTCRHFGGHVPEMGFVFIVFTPCLYCDVSDAWMFPSRSRRLAVTAAGVVVELLLAAVAAIVFFLTRPGWMHQAAFSLMVAASISTVLFNGNPLLRYDGYYLLSDWLEMPNLRLRARRYIAAIARRLVFDIPVANIDRPDRHRALLSAYAVTSYLYGWFILYVILGVVYLKLTPYGLQALAALLIIVSILVQLGLPGYRLLAAVLRLARTPGQLKRFVRPALVTASLFAAIVLLLNLPLNPTMSRACVVEPLRPIDVRAPHDGFVSWVHVQGSQPVAPGSILVSLSNPELRLELDRADADRRESEIQLARARAAQDQAKVNQMKTEANQINEVLRAAKRRVDELTILAPQEGVVLTERPADLKGHYVRKGDLLLRLGRPGEVKVALELSQHEAERIAFGSPAHLRVRSLPMRTFQGRVVHKARAASTDTPAVLTTKHGGEVAVHRTDRGWKTAQRVYRAEMEIVDSALVLRPGMSGRSRIHLGRTTFGSWLWQTVRDQLSLDILLVWPMTH